MIAKENAVLFAGVVALVAGLVLQPLTMRSCGGGLGVLGVRALYSAALTYYHFCHVRRMSAARSAENLILPGCLAHVFNYVASLGAVRSFTWR